MATLGNRPIATLAGSNFDYHNQAWLVNGRYVACGHPSIMGCACFGKVHAGEVIADNAEVYAS